MEYVFGTGCDAETLRVKSDTHTNLTGFHQIEQAYPDQTITDNFRIVCKFDESEDAEGNCYDWYEINRHYRFTDKTGKVAKEANEHFTELENAMCEQDEAADARMSMLEDAVCELDALING